MKYANCLKYTDITPFEVIRKTKKTIMIREMKTELDNFKPEIIPGGFAGICINQHDQKWIIKADPIAPVFRAYLRKDGYYYANGNRYALADRPVKYYDYNF